MTQLRRPAEQAKCRLYIISPSEIDIGTFPSLLDEALSAGDVACFQLRLKTANDDEIIRACQVLTPVAHAHDVAVLINDRPDLAKYAGADGAHVGQRDMSYEKARDTLGSNSIIGVTCHDSRHFAMVAAEAGADYVAFGAFFETQTKDAVGRAELDLLTWWQQMMEIPCVGIGGITVDNAHEVAIAGADFIAVSGGIWSYSDGPGVAVRALNAAIRSS